MISSKQRILTAVNHSITDRIPITFDAAPEVYAALHKHLGAVSKEELFDKLHIDTWMLLPGNFTYPESEEAKAEKTSIWGYKTRVTEYSGGAYDELFHSPLAGKDKIEDIDGYPWPDTDTLDFSHFPREAKAHSSRAIIGTFTWGAYFIATHVRGLENLMMDFALRKQYAERLIRTIADKSFVYLEKLLDEHSEHIDIVYMADDYCSQQGPLFSPEAFKKFVQPYLKRFVDKVHNYGKKFLLHCCGAVRPLLPMIIDSGVDMLEPIQTRARGMEPEGLKRDFGKDLCFYGGVDMQRTLCEGTPEQVADEVKMLIDILGQEGGYIIGPGHTYIQVDTPIENIMTMYETAYSCKS